MPFELSSRSLRRTRLVARAPRIALIAACAALCAAGLRAVTSPPSPPQPPTTASSEHGDHAAEEALAEAFTRAYLTWDASRPGRRAAELRRYAPRLADDQQPAPDGRQTVGWSAVSGDAPAIGGGRRVTVLADTTGGQTALSVTVRRSAGGLRVAGYPAIVGIAPAPKDIDEPTGAPVDDGELGATATRALRNYLAGRRDGLAADLQPGAVAVLPASGMRFAALEEMTWTQPQRAINAVARVEVAHGGELTLAYELGVARQAGRWFVRWIENQPTGE